MRKIIATLSILLLPIFAYGASWISASNQIGTNPVNGSVLQTNGIFSTWVATSSLGLGSSWATTSTDYWATQYSGLLTAGATTLSGGLTVNASATTTGTQYAGVLKLPVIAAPTYEPGLLFYEQYGALNGLSFYNSESDTTLNIGKEMWKDVRNCNSGDTILDGTAVYLTGVVVGQIPCVLPASATTLLNASVVGVATHDIENNTNGVVTTFGVLNGIDTNGLTEGTTLYLATSTDGDLNDYRNLTETAPSAPYYRVKIGETDYAHPTLGKIEVSPSMPRDLSGNKDVLVSSPTNNQLLSYDSILGYFKNVSDITVDNATTTNAWITGLANPAGSFLAVSPTGAIIATTSPTGGSQTPWTSDIDGGGYALLNVSSSTIADARIHNIGGIDSLYIGKNAGNFAASLAHANTVVGTNALSVLTSGGWNTAMGYYSLEKTTSGLQNTAIGTAALNKNTTGSQNTAIGAYSLKQQTVGISGNTALGYHAGAYETGSNSFYVNNRDLSNTANDKAYSLLYGTFGAGASLANQQLTVNGDLTVNGNATASNATTTSLYSSIISSITGYFTNTFTSDTASSTSLVVSDNFITVGSKKIYSNWEDLGISIAQPTTTDEVYKPMLKCLPPGSPSITIENVYGIIASTTSKLAENLEGMTFNINIAQSPSSTTPMTVFSSAVNLYSTSSQQTFTPTGTATIPANYCYWFVFPTASSSQIGVAGFGLTGKKN